MVFLVSDSAVKDELIHPPVYDNDEVLRLIGEELFPMNPRLIHQIMEFWWENQNRFVEEAGTDENGLPPVLNPTELIHQALPDVDRDVIDRVMNAEYRYLVSLGFVQDE